MPRAEDCSPRLLLGYSSTAVVRGDSLNVSGEKKRRPDLHYNKPERHLSIHKRHLPDHPDDPAADSRTALHVSHEACTVGLLLLLHRSGPRPCKSIDVRQRELRDVTRHSRRGGRVMGGEKDCSSQGPIAASSGRKSRDKSTPLQWSWWRKQSDCIMPPVTR